MLPDFIPLDSPEAVADFMKTAHCLHDSCIRSFFMSNPMYVNGEGGMVFPQENFPGESSANVIFQSQALSDSAIELELQGVRNLRCEGVGLGNDGIVLSAKILLGRDSGVTVICNPDYEGGTFRVDARSASWRLRPDLINASGVCATAA
jgi:hypothetical protein